MQETVKIYELLVKEYKTYPTCQITPEGLTVIAERLDRRYSYEQVEKAMNRLSYKARFFPSLAEIVEEIKSDVMNSFTPEGYRRKFIN
jgi:hypothetical protein